MKIVSIFVLLLLIALSSEKKKKKKKSPREYPHGITSGTPPGLTPQDGDPGGDPGGDSQGFNLEDWNPQGNYDDDVVIPQNDNDDGGFPPFDDDDSDSIESNIATSGLNLDGSIRRQYALEAATMFQSKNTICSPLSALIPLAKLAIGAKHEGLKEVLGAIGIRKKSQVKSKLKSLLISLNNISGVKLNIVSTIYVSNKETLNKNFESTAKEVFHSTIEKIDFSDTSGAAKTINDWVNTETRGKIPNIVKPEDIDPKSSLVLVNAIYFSGEWMHPFGDTTSADFYTENGVIQIPIMSQEHKMMYYKSDILDAEIVEIPYKEGYVSFVAVVPKAKNGLNILINQLKLTPELLDEEVRKMRSQLIKLYLPRFKIETSMDMGELYKKVGVRKIFTDESGLKEVVTDTTVRVSNAIQKAMIEVTETGTEAAAASVTHLYGDAWIPNPPKPTVVRIDHPFMFCISAERHQLFTGFFTGKP